MVGNGGKKTPPRGSGNTKPKPGEPQKKPNPKPQRVGRVTKKVVPPQGAGRPRIAKTLPHEDYLATLFNQHVDIIGRTIFLQSVYTSEDGDDESGTDAHMYACLMKGMSLLEQQDPKKPIKIVLSTFGGSVYYALAIYNRLKISPCHIVIHGYGPIMSGGSIIFAAADEGYLAQDASLMIHYVEDTIESMRNQERNSRIKEINRLDARLIEIYVERIERSGKSADKKLLHAETDKTLYLTAQQAVRRGFADGIITKP